MINARGASAASNRAGEKKRAESDIQMIGNHTGTPHAPRYRFWRGKEACEEGCTDTSN